MIKKSTRTEDYSFLLALLNSSVMWYFLKNTGTVLRGGYFRFKTSYLETFPIPEIDNARQQPFINKVDILISKNKELFGLKQALFLLLQNKYGSAAINNKLFDWNLLSFNEFVKELNKGKVKLSLSEQTEWMHHFEEEKRKAIALQEEITRTDKEIDAMVYKLYELTDEDIFIVEANN